VLIVVFHLFATSNIMALVVFVAVTLELILVPFGELTEEVLNVWFVYTGLCHGPHFKVDSDCTRRGIQ
jgi:hypothetical protein